MGGLFGSHTQSDTPQRYNGIQISSSASGGCVPLVYGQQRLPFNLIWYGAFTSTGNSDSGGKGGGGSQPTSYTYKSSFACALCEGPIISIQQVWNDKDLTSLSNLGFTLFTGAGGQSAWSYLTTNFPTQAVPYDHLAYVAAVNYTLGNSASMPNITFETQAFLSLSGTAITFTSGPAANATSATLTSATLANGTWNITFNDFEVRTCTVVGTAVTWSGGLNAAVTTAAFAGGVYDADPAAVVLDYLTDPNHGAGFPSANVATLTGSNSYQSYCAALGFYMSPMETTQRAASDFLKEILQITNSDAVWSAGTLKILPYCDAAVSGNGATFTPNLTPQFIFTDDDFLEPPDITRIPTADTFNHVRVEYLDRSNDYNTAIAEATDLGDIAINGERVMDTLQFHELTNSVTARISAQLVLQTSLYERNTIKFKVRADYSLLEPMDYIGICDPIKADGSGLGYGTVNLVGVETSSQVFRVTKVSDDENDVLEIEAMEVPGTVRSAAVYNWQTVAGYNANFAEAPGSVQAPAFMEAYGVLVSASGGRQLWIAAGGPNTDAAWGGCQVYMSFDGTNYEPIGIITGAARYGVISSAVTAITAVPDTTTTMKVTLNNSLGILGTGSASDALDNRMLIGVGSGSTLEIMSYETATLVSAGVYNLTTLYRGIYGTSSQVHSSGAQFIRLDGNVIAMDIDPGWLGQTLHFKFCSFNTAGRATEQLSAVTAYTYTPGVSATAYNSVSSSTFSVGGSCVVYSPTTAFKTTTAATAWDSSVYSTQSYTNGCTAECYMSQTTGDVMLGLTNNPLASNNFTNLAYAWYAANGAALSIYVGGSGVATFGSYTTTDLLAIVYDGKHVAFYHNAVLVYSVPDPNETFFMQICFDLPGASVYGMSFDNIATAVTPFTMAPMSNNVACAGTTAQSNGQDTTNSWGVRNFKSLESYGNGVQLSFSYATPTAFSFNLATLGFSASPATGGASPGSNSVASWYMVAQSTQVSALLGTTIVFTLVVAPVATDVYTLTYDNFTFRWWKNGALQHQEYLPNQGNLYLFGDFDINGLVLNNISFGPYGLLSPNPFIATGNCVTHDSTAYKSGGSAAWDSSVYSLNAYGVCHLQFKVSDITNPTFMIGLNTDPTLNANYTSIDHALFPSGAGSAWAIYESGTLITTTSIVAAETDLAAITYNGTTVTYLINGVSVHTTTNAGKVFYFDSSFNTVGAACNSMSFGPGTVLDTVPTASIDPDATSQIASTFSSTGFSVSTNTASPATAVGTSVTVVCTGAPLEIDISGSLIYHAGAGGTPSVTVTVFVDGSAIASGGTWTTGTLPNSTSITVPIPFTIVASDTQSAGSHTYAIAITATGGTGIVSSGAQIQNSYIKVREIKK